jgi:hypothetical protein
MKTSEFVNLLEENTTLGLAFEVEKGNFVAPTFHITEIKNASIESVDCGGNPDSYKQTIVQLMVNPSEELRKPWSGQKALSIFQVVDQKVPINKDAEIFFEYGDQKIRTSHFSVEDVDISNGQINIQLYAKPTVCKPSLVSGAKSCC